MPVIKLSDSQAAKLPGPAGETNQTLYYDDGSNLGLRVTAAGARTWFCEVWQRGTVSGQRGRQLRRSLGSVNQLSCSEARKIARQVTGEILQGQDRLQESREQAGKDRDNELTLELAVQQYVDGKRRAKDGLPLKDRTRRDYLKMVESKGLLGTLAHKPLHAITPDDMRTVYHAQLKRSQRQATYAMQVLRATLRWHGVHIAESPLDQNTAGKHRIILPSTKARQNPLPPEKIRKWWAASTARAGSASADGYRFQLIAGLRPGEVFGSTVTDVDDSPGLLVGNVDLKGGRAFLPNTKNREDFTVLLSKQALAIIKPHMQDRKPTERVFDVTDARKTFRSICDDAGVTGHTPHDLRATFTTVASRLCTVYQLNRITNHRDKDVIGAHYIGESETELRAAWQRVADAIAPTPVKRKAKGA